LDLGEEAKKKGGKNGRSKVEKKSGRGKSVLLIFAVILSFSSPLVSARLHGYRTKLTFFFANSAYHTHILQLQNQQLLVSEKGSRGTEKS